MIKKTVMKRSLFTTGTLVASLIFLGAVEAFAAIQGALQHFSGFSGNSRHYLHLESYREPGTSLPQAQVQIINIAENGCVSNGCLESQNTLEELNQTQKSTAEALYQKVWVLRGSLGLNNLRAGTRLTITSRKVNPDNSETITFTIPGQKQPTQVILRQEYIPSTLRGGNSDVDRASMELEINSNYSRLTLGDLLNYRDTVIRYSIREVRLSPNYQNLVLLIDMNQQSVSGVVRKTLVQGFPVL